MFSGHPISGELTPEELDIVATKLRLREYGAGDEVLAGEPDNPSVLFVISGAIELIAPIAEGVDRVIETARGGTSVGQVSFFDLRPGLGLGRAAEDTVCLELTRSAADEIYEQHPEAALHVPPPLIKALGTRVRVLGAQYIHAVEWGLKISGATQLNLAQMIADQTVVTLDLASGKSVSGTLLKVEDHERGTDIFLREGDGDLLIVPWNSVTTARIPGRTVDKVVEDLQQEG
jgi:hypothetical protein